ncbi:MULTISPECIES: D-2-hydroxyacid dehydrogenase [unclassified Beijerinckia]|uniref:D-2-hydroxyacid dehydrogenase n=1 Tax=unclassified Beijerinckia TaxID=2638183 RepID=UPI0008961DC1|nr:MULTISPECIES: D-2-hydroxyacid dehydrogenase [unclassified Beijerinckia]MDH7797648.1 D-2-hydroxyacid dehydrogenase (NADP+) [Beijerinckia sp. GAS462]SEC93648.1 Phosphoglycerate dehydrogenase [Beijerinckia sp. 28-YEA-48]
MSVLILEDGVHIVADDVRKACPALSIVAASNAVAALPLASKAEILVALAHDVTDDLIAAMPHLRYICSLTAGVDHLHGLKALKADVRITSGRGIHGPQMSELAFLYMIALSRNFPAMQANQRNHVWQRWPQTLLLGKTAVLIGIGPIAEDMAARCKAFGMQVIGISDARASAPGFDRLMPRAQLQEAAGLADFLIVLVPLSKRTRHMIDDSVLLAMKNGGILINLARGPVVDEAVLVKRLQDGSLGGAGLDVFEEEPPPDQSPLWDMPNVIITPRIGGMSDVFAKQILPIVAHNLACFTEGRAADMINVVR